MCDRDSGKIQPYSHLKSGLITYSLILYRPIFQLKKINLKVQLI